jgi:hypothetical protein
VPRSEYHNSMGLRDVMTQNYYFSANQNAKRLHGVPISSCHAMYSPHVMSIPYMTKQNRKRRQVNAKIMAKTNKGKQAPQAQPKVQRTPFADVGGIVGSRVGSMFGAPYLKGVGRWLGTGIGSIFGSGDYQMVGAAPSYNVIANGNQIPEFSSSKQTNIVCHREYLGDIQGTAGFNNTAFPLNPGIAETFPWLATIAQNYQEYKFHGLIFEFRPLITDFVTNGAPGVVVMATNYNADAPKYTTKQEMENSEYAVSVKPTRELMHGVECAMQQTPLPQLYIRSGIPPSGQDLRLYDLGTFQFATQTNPIQGLGELWVSYCVEFFKPVLPSDTGGNVLSKIISRGTVSVPSPLGTVQVRSVGDLNVSATSTAIMIATHPGNYYNVVLHWFGAAAATGPPNTSFSNCVVVPVYATGVTSLDAFASSDANASSAELTFSFVIQSTLLIPGQSVITVSGGSYPASSFCTINITQFSSEAVPV